MSFFPSVQSDFDSFQVVHSPRATDSKDESTSTLATVALGVDSGFDFGDLSWLDERTFRELTFSFDLPTEQLRLPQERVEVLTDSLDSGVSSATPTEMTREKGKAENRRQRNILSAKKSRDNKNAYVARFERKIQKLALEVINLRAQLNPDYIPEDPSDFLPVIEKVRKARMRRLPGTPKLAKEAKAAARMEANRISSKELRKKKSEYCTGLEERVQELRDEILNLQSQLG